jgi:ornithine decarboxylase
MHNFASVPQLVQELAPSSPVHILRRHAIATAAKWFLENFNGKTLYAVKTNPDEHVLKALFAAGIRHFDVASLSEIHAVRALFGQQAKLFFMHTVKNRHAIREAYYTYGVRDFSLDSEDELQKILQCTDNAKDLSLYVRLAIPNAFSEIDLSSKFGVFVEEAVPLLQLTRQKAKKLGVCFHVGSQCMHPDAYRQAIAMAGQIVKEAGVMLDRFDVGGGFPSIYPGMTPPCLAAYMETIHREVHLLKLGRQCKLMCEPGRALVAESGAVLVQVELRKDHHLYINDGTYGSLFDAGQPGFIFPSRAIRTNGVFSEHMSPFSFYGPTCDSMDFMKGPFFLPSDIAEGDYLEIGQLGAYGSTLRTQFNGFHHHLNAEVDDAPLLSMYGLDDLSLETMLREVA